MRCSTNLAPRARSSTNLGLLAPPAKWPTWGVWQPYIHPVTTEKAAPPQERGSYKGLLATFLCVAVLGVCLAWAYLSMRGVMAVGGSCASGGPYQISTPCPDGAWLIAIAIPVMIIASLSGSGFASTVGGPNLVVPMWGALFGSLGWNFLDYGMLQGDLVWSWILCGVMFLGMAAPALWWMGVAAVRSLRGARPEPGAPAWSQASLTGSLWWWVVYLVLGLAGAVLGLGTYNAIAT